MMTPINGEMVSKCAETMKASIGLSFSSPNISFSDIGKNAGLEIMAEHGTFTNAEKVLNRKMKKF